MGRSFESRREFLRQSTTFSLLSATASVFHPLKSQASPNPRTEADPTGIGYRSTREIGRTSIGPEAVSNVEGTIPLGLNGELLRVGPGARSVFGTKLQHFFDGDAFVSSFRFDRGTLSVHGRFVETEERENEQNARRMLYHEFGTTSESSGFFAGFKNPPSINVVKFGDKFLALSESAHPVLVEPGSLDTLGTYDFGGSLPWDLTFCAHPRRDPLNGDFYFFGFTKSLRPELVTYRVRTGESRAEELGRVAMGGFYFVHDMVLSENHIVLLIPPAKIDLLGAILSRSKLTDSLRFEPTRNLRAVIIRKDGTGTPTIITNLPNKLVFHHVSASESADGKMLTLNTILYDDFSIFDVFQNWRKVPSKSERRLSPKSQLSELKFDLLKKRMVSLTKICDEAHIDFPCRDEFDSNTAYFSVGNPEMNEPLAASSILKLNLRTKEQLKTAEEAGRVFGETVFAPGPNGTSWILNLGYDIQRDETFVDVRNSSNLQLEARAWTGHFLPLGFHGSFHLI